MAVAIAQSRSRAARRALCHCRSAALTATDKRVALALRELPEEHINRLLPLFTKLLPKPFRFQLWAEVKVQPGMDWVRCADFACYTMFGCLRPSALCPGQRPMWCSAPDHFVSVLHWY